MPESHLAAPAGSTGIQGGFCLPLGCGGGQHLLLGAEVWHTMETTKAAKREAAFRARCNKIHASLDNEIRKVESGEKNLVSAETLGKVRAVMQELKLLANGKIIALIVAVAMLLSSSAFAGGHRYHRSRAAKAQFMRETGYMHGRPGYVVDHVVPLKRGGCDCPSNMEWQTKAEAKAKDKWE